MSLADELALLADTKENLRVALNLSKDVPFSQYAAYIPTTATGTVFDFKNNHYTKDGKSVDLDDVSEFTRLSSATQWKDGVLVDVAANVMRLDKAKGLLIEKSSTELIPDNSTITSTNTAWAATSKADTQIGNVFEFVSDGSDAIISTDIPVYPNGNVGASSGSYSRAILVKKGSGHIYLGSASTLTTMIVNLSSGVPGFVGGDILQHSVVDIGSFWYIQFIAGSGSSTRRSLVIQATDNGYTGAALNNPSAGFSVTIAYPSFMDTAVLSQTIIKTSGTQVTRAPDTLNIPLLPTQTITGDWDEGVTHTVSDGIATFTGHGYIRNIIVEES